MDNTDRLNDLVYCFLEDLRKNIWIETKEQRTKLQHAYRKKLMELEPKAIDMVSQDEVFIAKKWLLNWRWEELSFSIN